MDDQKLISLVHQHEELFNMLHKRYNDNLYKDKSWRAIGEDLNQTGVYCKTRWFSLRDQYRRAMKNKRTKIGPATDMKKWKYEDEMSFLLPFLQERDLVIGVAQADDGNNCDEHEAAGSPSLACDAEGELPSGQGAPRRASEGRQPPTRAGRRGAEERHGARRTSPREPPSTLLMRYLLRKSEHRPDHIDNFFNSLAATVRSLSPIRQNVAKSKIFSIVSEIEMEQLMESRERTQV